MVQSRYHQCRYTITPVSGPTMPIHSVSSGKVCPWRDVGGDEEKETQRLDAGEREATHE